MELKSNGIFDDFDLVFFSLHENDLCEFAITKRKITISHIKEISSFFRSNIHKQTFHCTVLFCFHILLFKNLANTNKVFQKISLIKTFIFF